MQYKIKLNEACEIKNFVRDMQLYDVSMVITTLSGAHAVNPKSIIGMFSLDLSNPLLLTVNCDSPKVLDAIKEDIAKYEIL